jgi:hypothetical protein
LPGAITVTDNGVTHNAVVALVSHGADGHGAWLPKIGTSGSGVRLNTGSIDTDQLTNAHVNSSFIASAILTNFVKKQPTSTFDDVVIYNTSQWNINHAPLVASGYYCYSRAITIDYSKVPNTNQTNFPVYLSLTNYSDLNTSANGGAVINPSGYDIIFTSDAAGKNLLNFEQENYSASTGTLNYWVRIPTVSHITPGTTFYMFYGNPNINSFQGSAASVWDSNYLGVWDLPNGGALTTNDSTANQNNGTNQGATASAGKIVGGASFKGSSQYINATNSNSFNFTTQNFSIEFWIYPGSTLGEAIISRGLFIKMAQRFLPIAWVT